MSAGHVCAGPADAGYFSVCHVCGVPWDAGYFDVADIKAAPRDAGQEVELARYTLHPQYCGALLYFAQYAEPPRPARAQVVKTPGYEWAILCNEQPRAPYVPIRLILNPWGQNAFPVHLRLEEGCVLRFVVRKVAPPSDEKEVVLTHVGGRLHGRYWYHTAYGGLPNRL